VIEMKKSVEDGIPPPPKKKKKKKKKKNVRGRQTQIAEVISINLG